MKTSIFADFLLSGLVDVGKENTAGYGRDCFKCSDTDGGYCTYN